MRVVFVLGKGTVCGKLAKEFGFVHLSVGELLREAAQGTDERSCQIKSLMQTGQLVDKQITVGLLKDAIDRAGNHKTFLIDGYPSSVDRIELFETEIGPCDFVLYLDCKREDVMDRLLHRGRTDDNPETIIKRFNTFEANMLPVVEHYRRLDRVRQVCAAAPEEVVYSAVREFFLGS